MIVIIVVVPTEKPITRFFVARNRAGVVLVNFEAHRPATASARCVLGRRQQKRSDAAPADMGSHCDGVKSGDAGARRITHQRVAGELAAVLGDDQRGVWRSEEMAKASSRQQIDLEDRILDGEERPQIANLAAAQLCGG